MLHTRNVTGQWADWLIHGVRFDARHRHIELLFARADLGATISDKNETFGAFIYARTRPLDSAVGPKPAP